MALTKAQHVRAGGELAYTRVSEKTSGDVPGAAADGGAQSWLYVAHGIFGAGRNWASVARRVVRERPEWGALLLDLREHGGSQGFEGPHTLEAAADDIARLAESSGTPPAALLGHSFGGKVALMYARRHVRDTSDTSDTTTGPTATLRQIWIVDSTPAAGATGGAAQAMLDIVRELPPTFDSREAAITALVSHGVDPLTAGWMATNLVERGGAYRWRFNLDAMVALLDDFLHHDLWDVVESPPSQLTIHFVKATSSLLLSGAALDRVRAATENGRVFLHEVTGGHWLNSDNPDAMVRLLTEQLPEL